MRKLHELATTRFSYRSAFWNREKEKEQNRERKNKRKRERQREKERKKKERAKTELSILKLLSLFLFNPSERQTVTSKILFLSLFIFCWIGTKERKKERKKEKERKRERERKKERKKRNIHLQASCVANICDRVEFRMKTKKIIRHLTNLCKIRSWAEWEIQFPYIISDCCFLLLLCYFISARPSRSVTDV